MVEETRQAIGRHASAAEVIRGLPARLLIALVRLYQAALGPMMGGHCRFSPSCSHYAIESLRLHGALRGSWLAVRRVSRCHPFGGAGYDPVPPRER